MKSILSLLSSSLESALMGQYSRANQQRLHADAYRLLSRDSAMIRCNTGPSSICMGSGVFASHAIRQGDAICLYPGLEIPPFPHSANSITMEGPMAHRSHSSTSAYCISMCGGGSLDASIPSLVDLEGIENPSAIGHLINHASDEGANCESRSFHWSQCIHDETIEERRGRFNIPNRQVEGFWFKMDSGEEVCLPPYISEGDSISVQQVGGMAFIATRDLVKGEELFLDYQLNGPPYPIWARDWYKI